MKNKEKEIRWGSLAETAGIINLKILSNPQFKHMNFMCFITCMDKSQSVLIGSWYGTLEAHSFPGAWLSENCSLLETDNVRGQISEHNFAPNEGYCLYIHHLPTYHRPT